MKYRSISLMLAAKSAAIKYMNIDLSDMTSLQSLAKIRECVEIQREKVKSFLYLLLAYISFGL